jgi:lipid-A-disaccharide synthase-like uncharacterized protein
MILDHFAETFVKVIHEPMVIVGFCGQAIFMSRFLVQWIASERARRSIIPIAFWYLSLAGAAILLSYAIYIQDPVFVVGQMFGFIVYIRNLYLIKTQQSI